MPFLRMPGDDTLAETLGNLGTSLGNALNPLNRLKGYELQQRMWMQQEQLRQQLRENNAKNAAVQQWGHIVPAEKLPQIAAMIYQGAPYDQVARAAAQLSGNLKDDPNAMAENIRYIEQITGKPYDYSTLGPPVAGPNTAKQLDDWKVNQAGRTKGAETSAQIGAEQAGRAPLNGMVDADTPEAAAKNLALYRQVYGKDPDNGLVDAGPVTQAANRAKLAVQEAQKQGLASQAQGQGKGQAIADLTKLYIDKDDPASDANNRVIANAIHAAGGPPAPPLGVTVPVGPITNQIFQTQQAEVERKKAQATATGTSQVTGVDPSKPLVANPLITPAAPPVASGQTPAPPPSPPTAPVTAPVPKGATADPTHPGWYWQGGQLHPSVTTGGPAGTVFGTQPGDLDVAKSASEGAAKTLTDAYASGEAATKLKSITQQIRGLELIANTKGFWGQTGAGINNFLAQYNLGGITDPQKAQQLMKQLVTTELPGMLKQYDILRFAKPEIDLMGKVTGDPNADPQVVNAILANLDTAADYTLKRKDLASKALGFGSSTDPANPSAGPINYPEFQQGDTSLLNDYNTAAQANRQKYGAIGSDTPPNLPPATTQGGATPTPSPFQWLGDLFHNLGAPPAPGAPNTPPPPPDNNSRELRFDTSTNQWGY